MLPAIFSSKSKWKVVVLGFCLTLNLLSTVVVLFVFGVAIPDAAGAGQMLLACLATNIQAPFSLLQILVKRLWTVCPAMGSGGVGTAVSIPIVMTTSFNTITCSIVREKEV